MHLNGDWKWSGPIDTDALADNALDGIRQGYAIIRKKLTNG